MDDYISKVPEPLGSHLTRLDELVRERFPGVVVTHPGTVDVEGWLSYELPGEEETPIAFAGARFRRDKSGALTVLLSVKPDEDPQNWAHENLGKVKRLPYAFGIPRPHRKDVSGDEWDYTIGLIAQAYATEAAARESRSD